MLVACTCDATNTVHKELVFVLPTSEYAELRPDKKDADEAKWLKLLKTENARLKKMLVERDLEIEVLKETNASRCAKSKD
jgi:hypothetical protein